MQNFSSIKLIVLLILFYIDPVSAQSYRAAYAGNTDKGFLIVDIWDMRKSDKYPLEQARKDAVHAVLYSRISAADSRQSNYDPLLSNADAKVSFEQISKKFFSKNIKLNCFNKRFPKFKVKLNIEEKIKQERVRLDELKKKQNMVKDALRKLKEQNNPPAETQVNP